MVRFQKFQLAKGKLTHIVVAEAEGGQAVRTDDQRQPSIERTSK